MNHQEIVHWLKCPSGPTLDALKNRADKVRQENVGDAVHLRGLVELSNICSRNCLYCGIRRDNHSISRYRIKPEEVLDCARKAADFGFGSLVLQGGEDPGLSKNFISELITIIKAKTKLAITLSLGEREESEWIAWREAGADRYLLRFETSNRALFDQIHPPLNGHTGCDRIAMLKTLQSIGYETGSGVMIGIPGQTYDDLARDIDLFAELDLSMIGVGPFIPHPQTPLGAAQVGEPVADQVPNTLEMGLRCTCLGTYCLPWR